MAVHEFEVPVKEEVKRAVSRCHRFDLFSEHVSVACAQIKSRLASCYLPRYRGDVQ